MPDGTDVLSAVAELPLEWTRIQRTNRSNDNSRRNGTKRSRDITWDDDDESGFFGCCANSFCPTRQQRASIVPAPSYHSTDGSISRNVLSGTVLFCLTDPDCDWFQGYFFLTKQLYFGLLCLVKQDIDECLQCSEGGYREISMQMTPMNQPNNRAKPASSTPPIEIPRILWTGGDMMKLMTNSMTVSTIDVTDDGANVKPADLLSAHPTEGGLRMQTNSLFTGEAARDYVQKYFRSLLDNIQKASTSHAVKSDDSVELSTLISDKREGIEQIMPNVAIVSGTMDVWL